MLAGIGCLAVFWLAGYLKNAKQTSAWTLLAIGMLFSMAVILASGFIGGIGVLLFGGKTSGMVMMIVLAAAGVLWALMPWQNHKKEHIILLSIDCNDQR